MSTMGSHVRSGPRLPKSLTSSDDPNVAEFLYVAATACARAVRWRRGAALTLGCVCVVLQDDFG